MMRVGSAPGAHAAAGVGSGRGWLVADAGPSIAVGIRERIVAAARPAATRAIAA
jgi:hypothetical protein